jgi:hypothetical protein
MQCITVLFLAQEHQRKDPGQCFPAGVRPDVGALGDIEDARDCPEETPILLRLDRVARGTIHAAAMPISIVGEFDYGSDGRPNLGGVPACDLFAVHMLYGSPVSR